ncbi:putative Phosphoribosylaminoimidazole carboxylase [Amylocarpus encephaloides]|uniref:Phosphoribosylaminoimidazole carboxylase n=1 Tax=Amylocarpus encephaloides TaxID=45428 RepID=A0A9P8C4J2_9HELO|nr:putative Phosphoribosylaminoimidazole carboxylase [Amylocarpus encephaloides]
MNRTIGLLGGGQLGQMLCEAANPLGIKVVILDAENSPAKQVNAKAEHIAGSFVDSEKIRELARQVDVLTVEIEHVDTHVLEVIAEMGIEVTKKDGSKYYKKVEVQPSWRTIRTIQDKFIQKDHLLQHGIQVAYSTPATENTIAELQRIGKDLGYPFMLKARKDAYDGRGNFPVMSPPDIKKALEVLNGRELYAEKWAHFKMELAVMVVKTEDAQTTDSSSTISYPTVETIHEDSVCKIVYLPPRTIPKKIQQQAQALARKAVGSLWGKGVFGVELFLLDDGKLVVNEIAPRPHNSGHYTIEACPTMSQYKSQILSILGIMPPFPNNTIPAVVPSAIMLNILGGASKTSHDEVIRQSIAIPSAALHMYGKESKPGRKIGHITVVAPTLHEAETLISPLITLIGNIRAERKGIKAPSSKSHPETSPHPLIAVTMGSDSDLPVLNPGLALLESLSIPYHVTITSAHRMPARMTAFASSAVENGFKVIIAAAGGAAHLPGMIAASTSLPVIGVPVKGSTLDGMDSLLSIVQMPRGVPVATVAINNSINAALLAARILGTTDEVIRLKLEKFAKDSEEEVTGKARKLEDLGFEKYLEKR